ncbi:MAG: response regulator [Planctomycetota bacterium]
MRILLVEDSERLQLAVSTGLRREGHGVDVASDGEEGLRYARNNPYDVIVLDLMLPKLDGLGVLRELRSKASEVEGVHVLILTAKDTVEERGACGGSARRCGRLPRQAVLLRRAPGPDRGSGPALLRHPRT